MSLLFNFLKISLNPSECTTSVNFSGKADTPSKINTVSVSFTVRDHRLVLLLQQSLNSDALQNILASYPNNTGVTTSKDTVITKWVNVTKNKLDSFASSFKKTLQIPSVYSNYPVPLAYFGKIIKCLINIAR